MTGTTLKEYPYWPADKLPDIRDQLRTICNIRKDDISQIQNFTNVFLAGRTVGKIPTSSADVAATDKIGDLSYHYNSGTPYLYLLMENAGAGAWVRFQGQTF